MRYALTDATWAILEPMVRAHTPRNAPTPTSPDRMFFEAVLYWARTGVPWRDLPAESGSWSAVYNRLRRWIDSGRLERLFGAMTERPECDGLRRVMIDSTIVRAHQHAAGAPKKRGARRPTRLADRAAAPRRGSSRRPATRTA